MGKMVEQRMRIGKECFLGSIEIRFMRPKKFKPSSSLVLFARVTVCRPVTPSQRVVTRYRLVILFKLSQPSTRCPFDIFNL